MNLILDTDIGSDVDDALALAVIIGSPELHLAGISTVYGNTQLRAQLARRYLRIAQQNTSLPVAPGLETTRSGAEIWWAGHEGGLFDDLDDEDVNGDAIHLLTTTAARHAGEIDVLAIGPLTNIAAALDADPAFETNVRRLVIMGGDFSVESRRAEHNIRCDIAAAKRVFSSRLPIVIGGLDLTLKVKLSYEDARTIARSGPYGEVLAAEIDVWWKYNDARNREQFNSPHDPILALWIAKPNLFLTTQADVRIDDEGHTLDTANPDGNVTILDVLRAETIQEEIVTRVVTASNPVAASQRGDAR